MGYIKEPIDVNFVVDSKPLTSEDRKLITDAIAYYKATGKKILPTKSTKRTKKIKTPQKELI